jgi:hypothetical protein
VFQISQLAAWTQLRKQLPQNAFLIIHRAQHQRADHRVERRTGLELLDGAVGDSDRHGRGRRGALGDRVQPGLRLDCDHFVHGCRVQHEIRSGACTHLKYAARQAGEVLLAQRA